MQTWDYLKVLGPISVLPILGDLRIFCASLLLSLSHLHPLLRCQVLTQFREDILRESKSVE